MPIYGIMIELDEYIDTKRSQRHLGLAEREWMFEQRHLWQLERHNAFTENRMPARFIGRQTNVIDNNLLRETSFNNNSVNTSPLRELNQNNVQKRRHQKKKKISKKLKDQNMRSLIITSNNKRIEYFPEENIIIKGSGSATDPLDITKDNTVYYSDDEISNEKKKTNNIINYSLGKKKLIKKKIKGEKIKDKT
jgi:hypothetical protein